MTKKHLSILILFLVCSVSLFAQDTIRTKRDTILGKVEEVGIDDIKYRAANNMNGPLIVIDKRDVIQIKYENGTSAFFAPDPYDVASSATGARKKTHSIKFEFLAPIGNNMTFGYESMIKVGINLEFKLGIIGIGFKGEDQEDVGGLFVKAGVKFLPKPTYVVRGVKYSHGLRGPYFKPELIFSSFGVDIPDYNGPSYLYSIKHVRYTNGAVNVIFGIQHVLGDIMTLDYYAGIGYGFQTSSDKSNTNQYNPYESENYRVDCFSHLYLGPNSPLVITGGITLGFLF